jgi:hypothetical protein
LLGNHLPWQCGIATLTTDLTDAIAGGFPRFRAHEGALQTFLNGASTKDALGQEQGITQDFLASSHP